jgi:hypothetical protein
MPHLACPSRDNGVHVRFVSARRVQVGVTGQAIELALTAGFILAHDVALELSGNELFAVPGHQNHVGWDVVFPDVLGIKGPIAPSRDLTPALVVGVGVVVLV